MYLHDSNPRVRPQKDGCIYSYGTVLYGTVNSIEEDIKKLKVKMLIINVNFVGLHCITNLNNVYMESLFYLHKEATLY